MNIGSRSYLDEKKGFVEKGENERGKPTKGPMGGVHPPRPLELELRL